MKNETEKTTDRSAIAAAENVPLNPGNPNECKGNGEHDIECLCDECDYLMICADTWKKEGH